MTRPRSEHATQREQFADSMTATLRQLEAWTARAQIPGTPERAELAVRKGRRMMEAIAKRAMALRTALDPEPWFTAPTRERRRGVDLTPEPVRQGDTVVAVRHRIVWPVKMMQDRALVEPRHVLAGAWLRRAWEDSRNRPSTSSYSGFITASNPTGRLPTTRGELVRQDPDWDGKGHQPMAGEIVNFVWARLEEDHRAAMWCLVLEEPLPNEAHALNAAEFGRRIGNMRSEDHARWFALGMLRMTLSRLATIKQHWDVKQGTCAATSAPVAGRMTVAESTEKPLDTAQARG